MNEVTSSLEYEQMRHFRLKLFLQFKYVLLFNIPVSYCYIQIALLKAQSYAAGNDSPE